MPEITKTDADGPPRFTAFVWLALTALVLFTYLFGLTIPLVGPDEARYAQVAREMLERGDWITPTLGGENWFEKPALLYWLQIVSYKLFGVNEFAARLGSALLGLGTIAALWLVGRSASDGGRNSNAFANWLALIAASTLGLIVFARGASFDVIIAFPVTAALVSFYYFDRKSAADTKNGTYPLVLFYFFVGVGLLAKGLIGLLFPYAIVALYYLLSWRLPNQTFLISLFWGTVIAVATASVWYWPMFDRHGYEFVDEFFVKHHFQRFTTNKYQHPQPFYFFFWVLPLMTLPWLPFFLVSLWNEARARFAPRVAVPIPRGFDRSIVTLAIAWLAVPLVFFSLSGSKLPGYILPAVPAAIILASILAFQLVVKNVRSRNIVAATAVATLITTILLLLFVVPRIAERDSVRSLFAAAADRGYGAKPVLMLHTISHNAEFYAAGRLIRDTEGKQGRFEGVGELIDAVEQKGPLLVLVPVEYTSQLTDAPRLKAETVGDNGELAIVAVSIR